MGDNRNAPCFCGSGKKIKKCHSDIASNSAFAELIILYKNIDKRISDDTKFEKLKCKRGCAECCYQNFSVWSVEFYYILYSIYIKKGIKAVYDYIDKGYNMWVEYEAEYPEIANDLKYNAENKGFEFIYNVMEKSNLDNKFPCPFLNVSEGSCDVYNERPLVCREYAVSIRTKHNNPIAYCSNTIDNINYEEYMANVGDIDVQGIMKYYSEKFKISGAERPYPIFYFCKIVYLHKDNLMNKINEMKNISKNQYIDQKIERAIRRKNML